MKPLIGLTTNFIISNESPTKGQERFFLVSENVKMVESSGGSCILFPHTHDTETFERYLDLVDGIILTGGIDINPMFYGEEPLEKLGYFNTKKDFFDVELTKKAIQRGIPVLGIDRGLQVLNVALGGSLYQDISYMDGNHIKHFQSSILSEKSHSVVIGENSYLFEIFDQDRIFVNSFHHQAIKELGKDLVITAKASDGVIEGIEYSGTSFAMGVQWQPEFMGNEYEEQKKIFEFFIEKCK